MFFFSTFSYSTCCIAWCIDITIDIKALSSFISMLYGCGIARSTTLELELLIVESVKLGKNGKMVIYRRGTG